MSKPAVMRRKPQIAHVDVNSFYASAKRAFDPSLEGRPVIVLWMDKLVGPLANPFLDVTLVTPLCGALWQGSTAVGVIPGSVARGTLGVAGPFGEIDGAVG